MKIYTKTGDEGFTSLYGGSRVSKSHDRIDAYGTVDELNAYIGLLLDQPVNENRRDFLLQIQHQLFVIGSLLASTTDRATSQSHLPSLNLSDVQTLEREIDHMEKQLEPIRSFILPGGHISVSYGHITRAVCRRAERLIIRLHEQNPISSSIIPYMNRLSDYLFVLCRSMALSLGVQESLWNK